MKLFPSVEKLFEKTPLIALATADRQNKPNVVPIYWKKYVDEGVIILIDNFMNATKDNIRKNPNVCISFWDADTEEAYKIKGKAFYFDKGQWYAIGKKFMQEKKPDKTPVGVIQIVIEEVYDLKPGENAGKRIQ